MHRRSTWGWDDDLWMQEARVHDISEAWMRADMFEARCSCGLLVTFDSPPTSRDWEPNSGFHNFHARDRQPDKEFERLFYDAPGHRDTFHHSKVLSFASLVTTEDGWEYHLSCVKCGDKGLIVDAVTAEDDVDNAAILRAIKLHNLRCPDNRLRRNIHGIWSWSDDPEPILTCACGAVGESGQTELEFMSSKAHVDLIHDTDCTVYLVKLWDDPTERNLLIRCHHCDQLLPYPGWGGTVRYNPKFDLGRLDAHAKECFGGAPILPLGWLHE